jgi:hypothetical protein
VQYIFQHSLRERELGKVIYADEDGYRQLLWQEFLEFVQDSQPDVTLEELQSCIRCAEVTRMTKQDKTDFRKNMVLDIVPSPQDLTDQITSMFGDGTKKIHTKQND